MFKAHSNLTAVDPPYLLLPSCCGFATPPGSKDAEDGDQDERVWEPRSREILHVSLSQFALHLPHCPVPRTHFLNTLDPVIVIREPPFVTFPDI